MPTDRRVRIARQLEPPRSLSPTSASSWAQCELKYVLSYLMGWQEPSTMPQLIGNVVHRAVELLYGMDPGLRTRVSASELLRIAFDEERPKDTYLQLFNADDRSNEVMTSGESALDGLFALEDPTRITVGPEGLEVWVDADLYGARVRGRIDRIYDASGAQVIADYKTGKVAGPRYAEKAFFGLWTYAAALAAQDTEHVLADRIELLYLIGQERLSRPVLRDVAIDHAKGLARIWQKVHTTATRTPSEVYARPTKLCDWCAFKPACPAHQRNLPPAGSVEHDALLVDVGLTQRARRDIAVTLERAETPADNEVVL